MAFVIGKPIPAVVRGKWREPIRGSTEMSMRRIRRLRGRMRCSRFSEGRYEVVPIGSLRVLDPGHAAVEASATPTLLIGISIDRLTKTC